MRKTAIVVTAFALVALVGYAVVRSKPQSEVARIETVAEFTQQDLYTIEPLPLERVLPLTGTLVPFTEATLKAKAPGELLEVGVREGEAVQRGQVLARIDPTELRARVSAREADVAVTKAQRALAEKNLGTQKALLDKRFISQNAFDSVQSSYEVAVAKVHAAEADLLVAKKALSDVVLVAPFDGVVAQRHAQAGERVALDAKVITVVNLSRLELEAAVPATEIGQLRVGQSVAFRVDGFGDRAFAGHIDRINPATVSGSRSVNVYAAIDNADGLLRGGLFAQGAVRLDRIENALLVPASAVREEIGQTQVYALVDGRVKRKQVRVGPADAAGRMQVHEGLQAGDRIVKYNLGSLREGTAARLAGPQTEASR